MVAYAAYGLLRPPNASFQDKYSHFATSLRLNVGCHGYCYHVTCSYLLTIMYRTAKVYHTTLSLLGACLLYSATTLANDIPSGQPLQINQLSTTEIKSIRHGYTTGTITSAPALGSSFKMSIETDSAAQPTVPTDHIIAPEGGNTTPPLLNTTTVQAATTPPPQEQQRIDSACLEIADKLGSVKHSDCQTVRGFKLAGQQSVQQRPILYKHIQPQATPSQARVLLFGGIHADELSSISIVFHWLRFLEQQAPPPFAWKIIPLLNPDGLFKQPKATRENANGVDLNRNFPTPDWENNALDAYWVKRTDKNPRRYPGPRALSEPESLWLAETIERFQPDVIVAVHAPYGIIDFDGPPEPPDQLGRLSLNLLGTYPGSLGNYAGVQKNIPVITIELKYAGIMPPKQEIHRIWSDLNHWIAEHIPKETPPSFIGVPALLQQYQSPNGNFSMTLDKEVQTLIKKPSS